jgi:hypothetical protein
MGAGVSSIQKALWAGHGDGTGPVSAGFGQDWQQPPGGEVALAGSAVVGYTQRASLGLVTSRNSTRRMRTGDEALWKKEGPAHDRLFW